MSAIVLDFARHAPRERLESADVCSLCAHTHAVWPASVLEQLGREPRLGDWYCECGRLDLRPVDALELEFLREQFAELGILGRFYPTREDAQADLRRWRELGPNVLKLGGEIVRGSTEMDAPKKRSWRCRLGLHTWNVWRTERFLGTRSGRPILVRDECCTRCPEKRTRVARLP